jgi:hypothetical protein
MMGNELPRWETSMKIRKQRDQWAEHLRDEAVAHEAQQVAAGASHTPAAGPLPFSADDMEEAVTAAVQRERERCAAIADHWGTQDALLTAFSDLTEWELRAAGEASRAIASAIRGGPRR